MAESSVKVSILSIVGTIVFLALIAFSCRWFDTEMKATRQGVTTEVEHNQNYSYEFFEVDGMPCVQLWNGAGYPRGVSCDWSQRNDRLDR